MKKIIVAIDGLNFSESAVRYAVYIAQQINAHVVGVSLEDSTYHSYKMYELVGNSKFLQEKRDDYDKSDHNKRDNAIQKFRDICGMEAVSHSIHHDRNAAFKELLHESIYADLLIIDGSQSLTHYNESTPTRFIKDVLCEAQCPVLIVPKIFSPIDKLALLYDGEQSSAFAIRMFSYILSTFKNKPTEVITVSKSRHEERRPDNRLMKEFMKEHYPKAEYTCLIGDPATEIVDNLVAKGRNIVVVLGAYHRGLVSRWLKPSMADIVMEELRIPLFIAHVK